MSSILQYKNISIIDHFTFVSLLTWPLNGSEAGVDIVLIQTSLLFIVQIKLYLMLARWHLQEKSKQVSIKARSPPALLAFMAR